MVDYNIRVQVDPTGANTGIGQVDRGLRGLGLSADQLRRTFIQTFAVLAGGVGIVGSIRLLADFSQQMSTVQAITRATSEDIATLRDIAKDLGSNTRFSASQAAEGMIFLARAGFDANEVMESIDDTLRLAQAGALDLGSAADIASNVLTGFRLSADEATRTVDVLAYAANNANTNVHQLGEAMKFVAPVAAGVGVSMEEAAAAIAKLSDAGLQGSMAGTGLRRVISELESPSNQTREILAQVGLTADDVRVSQVGLTEALKALASAGVDTGTALEIFGDRGGPAFEVLKNAIPDVEDMTDALENAGGTAQRIADIMDDNLNGAILSVISALEGFILEIGDAGASGALQAFFNAVADGIRWLTENIDYLIIGLETLGFILLVQFSGAIAARAVAALKSLTTAMLLFNTAVNANPLVRLVQIVGSVIILIESLTTTVDENGESVSALTPLWRTLGDLLRLLEPVIILIGNAFKYVGEVIDWVIGGISDFFTAAGRLAANPEIITLAMSDPEEYINDIDRITDEIAGLEESLNTGVHMGLRLMPDDRPYLEEQLAQYREELEYFQGLRREHEAAMALVNLSEGEDTGIRPPAPTPDRTVDPADLPEVPPLRLGSGSSSEDIDKLRRSYEQLIQTFDPLAAVHDEWVNTLDLLDELVEKGITTQEYADVLRERVNDTYSRDVTPLITELEKLEEERELLRLTNDEREIETKFRQINNDLISQGLVLNQDQIQLLRDSLLQTQELNKEQEIYKDHMEELKSAADAVFGGIGSAIEDLVKNGTIDFRKLADSIISDLLRISAQAFIVKPLTKLIGFEFAEGGLVYGPGTGTSDSVVVRASRGEYIVNAHATQMFMPLLEAINSYAEGGQVGGSPTMMGGSGMSMGNSYIFSPKVEVNFDGSPSGDPEGQGEKIGESINRVLESRFVEFLERQTRPGGMLNSGDTL